MGDTAETWLKMQTCNGADGSQEGCHPGAEQCLYETGVVGASSHLAIIVSLSEKERKLLALALRSELSVLRSLEKGRGRRGARALVPGSLDLLLVASVVSEAKPTTRCTGFTEDAPAPASTPSPVSAAFTDVANAPASAKRSTARLRIPPTTSPSVLRSGGGSAIGGRRSELGIVESGLLRSSSSTKATVLRAKRIGDESRRVSWHWDGGGVDIPCTPLDRSAAVTTSMMSCY